MKQVIYIITYWLPNQSKQFSDPQQIEVPFSKYMDVIRDCNKYGYEVESAVRIER